MVVQHTGIQTPQMTCQAMAIRAHSSRSLLRRRSGADGRRGCFVVNTAVELAPHDSLAARRVQANWDFLETALTSALMRAQRPAGAAPCVAAVAESLPFKDETFDAAMAVATVHHWRDPIAGLREMQRVARRLVVFTHDSSDTGWHRRFWLTRDYLPEVADSASAGLR